MENNYENNEILIENFKHFKHIILNRPKQLNSIKKDMFPILTKYFKEFESDSETEFIICSGRGKSFCAGGDLIEITNAVKYKVEDAMLFVKNEYEMDRELFYLKKPYISLMNGYVMGGGLGLSIPAKYRICNENTIVSMPENSIGFYVDVLTCYYLSRLPYNLGIFISLTGYRLNYIDCLFTGICTHFIENKNILLFLKDCEKRIDIDQLLKEYSKNINEKSKLELNLEFIQKCFSFYKLKDILSFLKQESKNNLFAKEINELIKNYSPTGLKTTFKMIKKSKLLNIDQEMKLNYYKSCWLFQNSKDFIEGVRAKVIDKDNDFKWESKL